MEKLWNLSKTATPMEKLWNFRFGGKNDCFFNQSGEKMRVGFDVVSLFVASAITSLALRTPDYSASLLLGRVNTCLPVNIVRPLSQLQQLAFLSWY